MYLIHFSMAYKNECHIYIIYTELFAYILTATLDTRPIQSVKGYYEKVIALPLRVWIFSIDSLLDC